MSLFREIMAPPKRKRHGPLELGPKVYHLGDVKHFTSRVPDGNASIVGPAKRVESNRVLSTKYGSADAAVHKPEGTFAS
jgi:hypothetical protein